MKLFRILLIIISISILTITSIVVQRHGWNLFQIFFGEMLALSWSGQFNFDFTYFLLLSALWVAWRNQYSVKGIILSLIAFVGGIMFLAPYLLILSFKSHDIKEILCGKNH